MASKEEKRWLKERMKMVEEWSKTRPPIIRALAKEFPFLLVVTFGCEKHGVDGHAYVIGYTEAGQLLLSPINPCKDHEASIAARFPVDPEYLRQTKCHGR